MMETIVTSLSAGSQQVHNVVMVTKMAEDLQLWHQSVTFLQVSARCTAHDRCSSVHWQVVLESQHLSTHVSASSLRLWWRPQQFPDRTPSPRRPFQRPLTLQQHLVPTKVTCLQSSTVTIILWFDFIKTSLYRAGVYLWEIPTCGCTAAGWGRQRCSCSHWCSRWSSNEFHIWVSETEDSLTSSKATHVGCLALIHWAWHLQHHSPNQQEADQVSTKSWLLGQVRL